MTSGRRRVLGEVAGGLGVALLLVGCAMVCIPLYSRLFGLGRFFASLPWWRPAGVGLILGGLAVSLPFLLAGRTPRWRLLPPKTAGEGLKMILQVLALVLAFLLFFGFSVLPLHYRGRAEVFVSENLPVPEERDLDGLASFLGQVRLEHVEEGVFDCSEASALVEWLCEGAGFHALLALGYRTEPSGERRLHTWVVVELENGRRGHVEATTLTVTEAPENLSFSLYESPDDLIKGTFLLSEFDWWNVRPYRDWGGFSRWELLPSRFWYLLETPDRRTGCRVVSGVLFTLLFVAFYASILKLLGMLFRLSEELGERLGGSGKSSQLSSRRGLRISSGLNSTRSP
jgi:hypothetical protein